MRTPKLTDLIGQLSSDKDSDGELLASFVATRDECAFAELVRRHGAMVLGVCRRVTGDHHVAEEAFQVAFLVLVAKAANIRPPEAVAAWLHGVAVRTAVRARTTVDRRRRREAAMTPTSEPSYSPSPEPEEYAAALATLDEEIARLPEYYRLAVVLCELEGCSRADVAARLNIPEGTLSSRLGKARKTLATRLRKRGIVLSSAGLSGVFAQIVTASTPQAQLSAAAALVLTPARLPESALSLSRIVLRTMLLDRLKVLGLCILALGVAFGASAFAANRLTDVPPVPPEPPRPVVQVDLTPPVRVASEVRKPNPIAGRILFDGGGHVSLIDPDGKERKVVAERGTNVGVKLGRLSPDGKLIAYTRRTDQLLPQDRLYYRVVGSTDEIDLGVSFEQYFAWSPNSTEIAFSNTVLDENTGGTRKERRVVNLLTKETTVLKLPPGHTIMDWSRDGKYFLTRSISRVKGPPDSFAHLCLIDRSSGEIHKTLTDPKQYCYEGRLSPDGTRLLCIGTQPMPDKDGRPWPRLRPNKLWVLDLTTDRAVKVSPDAGYITGFCWSPDGKRIAYSWGSSREPVALNGQIPDWRLVTCDPDGKNPMIVLSEKGIQRETGPVIGSIDWR